MDTDEAICEVQNHVYGKGAPLYTNIIDDSPPEFINDVTKAIDKLVDVKPLDLTEGVGG